MEADPQNPAEAEVGPSAVQPDSEKDGVSQKDLKGPQRTEATEFLAPAKMKASREQGVD